VRPQAADLIEAWERGTMCSVAARGLVLLRTVRPESEAELADKPVGWIAGELLMLRAAVLGPTLVCLVDCPRCQAITESEIAIDQLIGPRETTVPKPRHETHLLREGDHEIEFRLPTSMDLLALSGDPGAAAHSLARSLIVRATAAGVDVSTEDLPQAVREGLERAVLTQDPLSHIELALTCPACGVEWPEPFDAAEFVWTELSAVVRRLLTEVARLASAFGWREADILAMSVARRQSYLELLAA
jgi:hypothetical protein